jgi:hypothetical protein
MARLQRGSEGCEWASHVQPKLLLVIPGTIDASPPSSAKHDLHLYYGCSGRSATIPQAIIALAKVAGCCRWVTLKSFIPERFNLHARFQRSRGAANNQRSSGLCRMAVTTGWQGAVVRCLASKSHADRQAVWLPSLRDCLNQVASCGISIPIEVSTSSQACN